MDVGLRELRQQASELVRRVEAGESFTVTVSGRGAARLVPVVAATWRPAADLAAVFTGVADEAWEKDRLLIEDEVRDPWSS